MSGPASPTSLRDAPAGTGGASVAAADPSTERTRRALAAMSRAMGAVATAFYALLCLLLLADVVGRELFGTGIFGAQRVAVFAMIIAGNFGLALAAASGSHIRPRIADHWLPAAWNRTVDRIADIITAAVFLAVAVFAAQFALESYAFETVSPVIDWPVWPIQMALPAGYGLAALQYIAFAAYPALRPAAKLPQE